MLKKKWFLYLTGFFSGMSIMGIELGASRLLSPYFSSSQIVWTIIIGTIMIAMALGNVLGGKMADKFKEPTRLFVLLFSAAVWTALIPFLGKFIMSGIALGLATFITHNYLIWAALVSCIVIFVYPLLILGMVTPNLVKYACNDLENSGRVVGTIEALNTIGSIIGTFLPTFVTIPSIGTTWTFEIFASILFIITMTYFIIKGVSLVKKLVVMVISLALGIASSFIPTAFWESNVIYEGESIYNYLRVADEGDEIIFSTNVLFGVQSVKMKNSEFSNDFNDTALASVMLADGYNKPVDVLVLGLGTGTFPTHCLKHFKINSIDGVEIDDKIIWLAHEYFDLPEEVNTFNEDGRAYMARIDKMYDVIFVDAYQDISIPFSMSSIEFFKMVKSHLKEDGCLIVNMNMFTDKEGSIIDHIASTINNVFDSVYTSKKYTNLEIFASDYYNIEERFTEKMNELPYGTLRDKMDYAYTRLNEYTKTEYILTDDRAPVERLSMNVLDDMIEEELTGIKEMIKGKSIKELIEMLLNGELG